MINKKEKRILNLTLAEVAQMTTEMVYAEIDAKGGVSNVPYFIVNNIIRDVINELIPKETCKKMGIEVHAHVMYSTASVAQNAGVTIRLRKGHPFYNDIYKHDALSASCSVFRIRRTKVPGGFLFKCIECEDKAYGKKHTLIDFCRLHARFVTYRQNYDVDYARVILAYRKQLGTEALKELFRAVNALESHVPPYSHVDWTNEDVLKKVACMTDRAVNILEASASGKRVMPAGIDNALAEKILSAQKPEQDEVEYRCGICTDCLSCPASGTGVAFPCPHYSSSELRITEIESMLSSSMFDESDCPMGMLPTAWEERKTQLEKELASLEKLAAIYYAAKSSKGGI